jgi:hypothetical protein
LDAERWELGAERFCGRCEKKFTTKDTESTKNEKRDPSLRWDDNGKHEQPRNTD